MEAAVKESRPVLVDRFNALYRDAVLKPNKKFASTCDISQCGALVNLCDANRVNFGLCAVPFTGEEQGSWTRRRVGNLLIPLLVSSDKNTRRNNFRRASLLPDAGASLGLENHPPLPKAKKGQGYVSVCRPRVRQRGQRADDWQVSLEHILPRRGRKVLQVVPHGLGACQQAKE
jgi:hypothetical protein